MNQRIEPTLGGNAPPPLPPRATPPAAPPPKRMHGCLIALLVGLALLVPLAILAAIALPAYQDYMLRAKVMSVFARTMTLKLPISAAIDAESGQCPVNGDEGIGTAESYADAQIAKVEVGTFEGGKCGFEIELRGFDKPAIDGGNIWWELSGEGDAQQWQCSSSLDDKYLPASCRAP